MEHTIFALLKGNLNSTEPKQKHIDGNTFTESTGSGNIRIRTSHTNVTRISVQMNYIDLSFLVVL